MGSANSSKISVLLLFKSVLFEYQLIAGVDESNISAGGRSTVITQVRQVVIAVVIAVGMRGIALGGVFSRAVMSVPFGVLVFGMLVCGAMVFVQNGHNVITNACGAQRNKCTFVSQRGGHKASRYHRLNEIEKRSDENDARVPARAVIVETKFRHSSLGGMNNS